MELDISISANSYVSSAQVVSASHFGIIQTGFGSFAGFESQFKDLNGQSIRWPGGTLSEVLTDVYGLSVPGIFDGTKLWNENVNRVRPDLSDMLDFSNTNNIPFSMVLPTVRYLDNLDQGIADIHQFLSELGSGHYGNIPSDFTLEIGNEYYALPAFSDASDYGLIVDSFLEVIAEFRVDPKYANVFSNINVAVQMGKDAVDDVLIRQQISDSNLVQIDTLVAHHLPNRLDAIDKIWTDSNSPEDLGLTRTQQIKQYLSDWSDQIERVSGDANDLKYFLSAWNIGSASNVETVNLQYQDYGARQASALLDVFSNQLSIGVSAAAIWGVDVNNLNSLSKIESGQIIKSSGGAMFEMMSESLVGYQMIDGFEQNDRTDTVMIYGYRNGADMVLFAAANDIPDTGITINVDLSHFGEIGLASAVTLSYTLSDQYDSTMLDEEARLFEQSILLDTSLIVNDQTITFDIQNDFDVVKIEFSHANPADLFLDFFEFEFSNVTSGTGTDDTIYKTSGQNSIRGGDGNDVLVGGVGRDYIEGASGNDILIGDISDTFFGNDVLVGGVGDDILFGGGGSDHFVFNPGDGNDVIGDSNSNLQQNVSQDLAPEFTTGLDVLVLSQFGYESADEALEHITETQYGLVFNDQQTRILFVGTIDGDINSSDIFLL